MNKKFNLNPEGYLGFTLTLVVDLFCGLRNVTLSQTEFSVNKMEVVMTYFVGLL